MKILIAFLLALCTGFLLVDRLAHAESMASHEAHTGRAGETSADHAGSSHSGEANQRAIDTEQTDADFERNQQMIDSDEVDTSVDSCASGCVTAPDIDTDESGGGLPN